MKIVVTYADLGKDEYPELIKMAFASAKLWGYETVLVCTRPKELGQDHTLIAPMHGKLMPWVLDAQSVYINSALFNENSVLFSPDALIAKPLEPVFLRDFELGVTQGTHPQYPVNNGVIYIRPETRHKLSKLWADMYQRCQSYPEKIQDWYGDQLAVHEEIRAHADKPYGLNVKRLPANPYNAAFTKEGNTGTDELIWHSAFVIHFKGSRKKRMEEFWHKIQQRNTPSMTETYGPLRTPNAAQRH